MSGGRTGTQRSKTGNHVLLPADTDRLFVAQVAIGSEMSTIGSWTFGSGTVIWKIWPAILLHTAVAALVTTLSLKNVLGFSLAIPNIMMTVLGVVIGFVLSYRVSTGYDRYWLGRSYWSDIVRDTRTLSRLIWYHVPLMTSPPKPAQPDKLDDKTGTRREEVDRVMREKRMALDLIEGFTVALKHRLRGEYGIYYEDLYHLVRPLHDVKENSKLLTGGEDGDPTATTTQSHHHHHHYHHHDQRHTLIQSPGLHGADLDEPMHDPVIPPVNSYGATGLTKRSHRTSRSTSRSSSASSSVSDSDDHTPLLPSAPQASNRGGFGREIKVDLIPFITFFSWVHRLISPSARKRYRLQRALVTKGYVDPDQLNSPGGSVHRPRLDRLFTKSALNFDLNPKPISSSKHRQNMYESTHGDDRNIPLETIRSLSEYFAVLETRGVVPGTSMGNMIGQLTTLEDALSGLERILTTPLPWVYSVHIRHCIWIYLFFLPFQLIGTFGWYTIPGVAVATFYFLGFLAAGEEIEQPFGYDENDLDIESFIEVIAVEMKSLKGTACPNAVIPHREDGTRRVGVEESSRKQEKDKGAKRKGDGNGKGKRKRSRHKHRQSLMDVFGEV